LFQRNSARLCLAAAGVVLVAASLWAVAALYFDTRISWLRIPLAIAFAVGVLAAWVFCKRRLAAILNVAAFALVLGWWLSLPPSNERDWQPELAQLPYAEFAGNQVTVRNIRNCDYRSEADFEVRYYDRTFEMNELRSADLYMVYWGSPHMAHTMVSFGFSSGDYVCFSIETRKEKGEGYSAVKGLFRQFELIYVVGDERDLVRLRTNYRKGEDAYLYRFNASSAQVRELFVAYLNRLNQLKARPEWYNALSQNCTTSIRTQRAASSRAPWDWRMLVNGHGDELLYARGAIATNVPLRELKERCLVNQRALAADKDPDFSRKIRLGIPGMEAEALNRLK
jgi:hypothetical protein